MEKVYTGINTIVYLYRPTDEGWCAPPCKWEEGLARAGLGRDVRPPSRVGYICLCVVYNETQEARETKKKKRRKSSAHETHQTRVAMSKLIRARARAAYMHIIGGRVTCALKHCLKDICYILYA